MQRALEASRSAYKMALSSLANRVSLGRQLRVLGSGAAFAGPAA